jgi:hypothetical protein
VFQVRNIRKKMLEIIVKEVSSTDLKEPVSALLPQAKITLKIILVFRLLVSVSRLFNRAEIG